MSGKVVVTGGAGFVGSHAVEHFVKQGHEVIVCDNLSRGSTLGKESSIDRTFNWNYLKQYPSVQLNSVDIRQFEAVQRLCKGAEIIIDTAGPVAVTSSVMDPSTDFETNVVGTFNVLEAARQNDAAVVFCSTNKVYGNNIDAIALVENPTRYSYADPYFVHGEPETLSIDHSYHSPYGASKLAADIYVQEYARTYQLKTASFRMSCIYGERQFGVEDQ